MMMFLDPRIEWRINDVERKADEACRRLYQIDEVFRRMDSLEHSLREACSQIDGLRNGLQACEERIRELELSQEQGK